MNKKLWINRSILFSFAIIAVPITILQGMFDAFDNNGNGIYDSLNYLCKNELVYFTIISNIMVFIWAMFAFINIFLKSKRLDNFLEHPLIKGTTFLFIIITGVIFNSLLIWHEAKDINSNKGIAELITNLLGRSFIEHFMVPIFMTLDIIFTKGYRIKKRESSSRRAIILLLSIIPPLTYLFVSLILIKLELISPQYFFMDFFSDNADILTNSVIIIGVSTMWILLWLIMQYLTNKLNAHNVHNNMHNKINNNIRSIKINKRKK